MSSCIYLLHVSLIAITLSPQPHGDGIAFANTLRTARSIPLAHPSHSATWLLPARAELGSLVVWPSRDVVPLGRVCSYLHTGLDFLSKERRRIKALAIGVVVEIILLLCRLADWFEQRSFLLWLVFYLLAGGLTIALLGTANAGH